MANFSNIGISISGTTILAESVSISEQNNIVPTSFIGYRGPFPTSPNAGLNHTISFDYILENSDINYKLLQRIREYDFNSFPVTISAAGITGAGYMNNYSLQITPNDAIKATVSYNIFTELTGRLSQQSSSNSQNYNLLNSSGVAHGWNSYAKNYAGTSTGSILELDYSFSLEWATRYKIGNPNPISVKFINGTENFEISSEYESRILYSGQNFSGKFTDFDIIEINSLSKDWSVGETPIKLYLQSGKVVSNNINITEDSLILNNTSIIKYW